MNKFNSMTNVTSKHSMAYTTRIEPRENFIGNIYGVSNTSPIKTPICFIVTRITKKFVVGRALELKELKSPKGNGYFNHQNLGKTCIKKPLTMVGKKLYFRPQRLPEQFSYDGINAEYITQKNIVAFRIHEDIIWSTLSVESSVWEKVGQ